MAGELPETTTQFYLVPTPIGNLDDITLRSLKVLQSVDAILCEDTRTSGNLLKHYQIHKPLISFHVHNEHKSLSGVVNRLKSGQKLAYISDAGTPGISDPGFLIARACIEEGIDFECLPGATALIPALLKSGFAADRFVFEGFLPLKKGRQTRIRELSEESRTIVLYESPHRIGKTLEQLSLSFGNERRAALSREISKKFEETIRGTLEQLYNRLLTAPVKGEMVLVIEGKGHL